MNILLGSVKPSGADWLTALILPPPLVYGENHTLPTHLGAMVDLLKPGVGLLFFSTLHSCHTNLWQSDWFSPIIIINFNISLLNLPMRKSKLTLI
jgi:hypothetical protein